jgi:membrane fusion protein
MTADADIILEKRSLLEWLLDPIYAVKGKIG